MPFVAAIRRVGSARIHEVSSPGSNSDDYERCTAPTELEYAEQQARIAEIRRQKLEHAEDALRKRREQVSELREAIDRIARELRCVEVGLFDDPDTARILVGKFAEELEHLNG